MSLGAGLGRLAGRVFRIGHLGDLSDLSLAGALCGVEMGLARAGVPIAREGVSAALDYLGRRQPTDPHGPRGPDARGRCPGSCSSVGVSRSQLATSGMWSGLSLSIEVATSGAVTAR